MGTIGQRDQHGRTRWVTQQVAEQLDRCCIRPVQIVEDQHEAVRGPKLFEQGANGAVQPVPLGSECGTTLGVRTGQRGEDLPEQAYAGRVEPLERLRAESGDPVVESLDDDAERRLGLELGCPGAKNQPPGACRLASELLQKPALPYAGLTCHSYELGRPRGQPFESTREDGELRLAPDDRASLSVDRVDSGVHGLSLPDEGAHGARRRGWQPSSIPSPPMTGTHLPLCFVRTSENAP